MVVKQDVPSVLLIHYHHHYNHYHRWFHYYQHWYYFHYYFHHYFDYFSRSKFRMNLSSCLARLSVKKKIPHPRKKKIVLAEFHKFTYESFGNTFLSSFLFAIPIKHVFNDSQYNDFRKKQPIHLVNIIFRNCKQFKNSKFHTDRHFSHTITKTKNTYIL